LTALLTGGAVVAGSMLVGALPSYASTAPGDPYTATLAPYVSTTTGHATLTHFSSSWIGTAQLRGLTSGDTYEYEAQLVTKYDPNTGDPVGFRTVELCSFVATSSTGSCGVSDARLDTAALSPGSSAFVYSPQAHTSVAIGPFSYQAVLSPYDQLSKGGDASLSVNPNGTWSGRVSVAGLTPGDSYTWAADVAEAYVNGQVVSTHRIVLCQFVASTSTAGCSVHAVSIEGRDVLPVGSYSDVASTLTSVASGTLY
jgi:hypothetical protein